MAVAKKFWNITQDKRPKVAVDLYNAVKSYYGCNINDCKKAVFDAAKAYGYLDGVESNGKANKWGTVDAFWGRPGLRKKGMEALGRAKDAEEAMRKDAGLSTTTGIVKGDIKGAVEKYMAEVSTKEDADEKADSSVWDSMAEATGLDANLIKWVLIGAVVLLVVAVLFKVRRKK